MLTGNPVFSAVADVIQVPQDHAAELVVTQNDQLNEGEFDLVISTAPSQGTAEVVDGVIVYSPNEGFQGADSLEYTLLAADGSYSAATVSLTVIHPMAATSDFDADGIPRSADIDDDNDGILDTAEGADVRLDLGAFDGLTANKGETSSRSIPQPGGSNNVTLTLSSENKSLKAMETVTYFSSRDPDGDGSGLFFNTLLTKDQTQTATFEFDTPVSHLSFVIADIDSGNLSGPEAMTITSEFNGEVYTLTPDDIEVIRGPGPTQTGNSFSGAGSYAHNVIRVTVPALTDKLTFTASGTQEAAVQYVVSVFDLTYSIDTDADGVIDALDLDSDNDGISDLVESGASAGALAADANRNGTVTIAEAESVLGAGQADLDQDGLLDPFDADTTSSSTTASVGTVPVDTDLDQTPDMLDLDSDADGIPDTVEARPTADYDGFSDDGTHIVDSDGDGIVDRFDSNSHFGASDAFFSQPVDTDDDGIADFTDTDSDNDTVLDVAEASFLAQDVSYSDPDGSLNAPATTLANEVGDQLEVAYREIINTQSTIRGAVVLTTDTEDAAFAGLVGNNEIRLTGTNDLGEAIDTTVLTDPDGSFEFVDLRPGTYSLSQTQPPFVVDGDEVVGTTGRVGANDTILDIVVEGDASGLVDGFEFREMAPASVSGFVYHDEQTDHVASELELGIGDAQVSLSGTNDRGEAVTATATTDSRGFYSFEGLRPGTYVVTAGSMDGFVDGTPSVGSQTGSVQGASVSDIVLAAGDEAEQYNFAKATPSSIAGSTYLDHDKDGVFDKDDTALSGVTVTLTGTDIHGNPVERTQQTSSDGSFLFDNLTPGTYDLAGEQPEGLLDGRENLGHAVGQGNAERDGVRGNDVITGIQVGYGEQMEGYAFGERVAYEFASEFDNDLVIQGTGGDDVFEFTPGSEQHSIRLNGVEQFVDASQISSIRFEGMEGNDSVTIHGTDMTEKAELWPLEATMHSRDWRVQALSSENITMNHGGGYDVAYLYDSAGDDRLKATESYARMWSTDTDPFYNQANGFHRTYAHSTEGGADRAYLYDSARDDTMKAEEDRARMFSRHYYNAAIDFERVYGYANAGGSDTLRMWDSEQSNDTFESRPEYARLYNSNFYNYGTGFETVIAAANRGGSDDEARIYGTSGDNTFIASARGGVMTGDGLNVTANSFERLYGHAEGGNDHAILNDTIVRDNFVARPGEARMYNNSYLVAALEFGEVDAYSSQGGNDRAYFYDSEGNDTIEAIANDVRMHGDSFDNASHGFRRTYITADAGGYDTATLYESDKADTFDSRGSRSRMYGDGYFTQIQSADKVSAVFGAFGEHDRAIIEEMIDDEVADTIRMILATENSA